MKKLLACFCLVCALPAWAYTINITEPAEDRAYLRPTQLIDVQVMASPTPSDAHRLVLSLNDDVIANNEKQVSLPTVDYELGQYTLRAKLQDENGRVLAEDSRQIYIIPQQNALIRQQREATAQKEAYQALPWYKKVYVRMRQGDVELTVNPQTSGHQGIKPSAVGGVSSSQGLPSSLGVAPVSGVSVPAFGVPTSSEIIPVRR